MTICFFDMFRPNLHKDLNSVYDIPDLFFYCFFFSLYRFFHCVGQRGKKWGAYTVDRQPYPQTNIAKRTQANNLKHVLRHFQDIEEQRVLG